MENYVSIMRRWHHMHHGKKYGLQDGVLIGKCLVLNVKFAMLSIGFKFSSCFVYSLLMPSADNATYHYQLPLSGN